MIGRGLGICIGSRVEGDIDTRLIHGRENKNQDTYSKILNSPAGVEKRGKRKSFGWGIYKYIDKLFIKDNVPRTKDTAGGGKRGNNSARRPRHKAKRL